jgi:cell division protein FtsB
MGKSNLWAALAKRKAEVARLDALNKELAATVAVLEDRVRKLEAENASLLEELTDRDQ